MVSREAAHWRCLFSTSQTQTFALVLAFNHGGDALRFLVFDPGGLPSSEEYDITKCEGLKEIARLFLTLLSWHTARDAGTITYCSDSTYLLPADQEGTRYVLAVVDETLSWSRCVRGRRTFASRLLLPTNAPLVIPESLRKNVSKRPVKPCGSVSGGRGSRDLTPD